jgi:nucleotide-binding universal stress UspA family protein
VFGRILVATDLTPATRMSLRTALDLARPDDGVVWLLHVIERIPNLEDRELSAFYERLAQEGRARLLELSRSFVQQRRVDIQFEVVIGQPATEVVRVAEQHRADLIVLQHHSRHDAPALGSVSYKVGILANCSVLLLKRTGEPPE